MNRKAKEKVVTSGRLTGTAGRRATPDPGPAAWPEPRDSLYSTNSDQVTTLHKGLDQCAALLSGILQAEKAASPGPKKLMIKPRASTCQGSKTIKKGPTKSGTGVSRSMKPVAGKPRPSTSQGAAALRKPQTKDLRHSEPDTRRPAPPALLSRQKLHPSPSAAQNQTPRPPLSLVPPPQTSVHVQTSCPSGPEVPRSTTEWDGLKEVPVKDSDVQVPHEDSHTTMGLNLQVDPGVPENSSVRGEDSRRTEAETVDCLLGELKALIAGQGSVAERLLLRLEQVVSSQINVGCSNVPTGSPSDPSWLPGQSAHLCRCVKISGKADEHQKQELLSNLGAVSLKEDLLAAQSRLQELQEDFTELRKALQDTQSQLRDKEEENTLLKTDLKATREHLQQTQQQKMELASLAQQRLEEIGALQRCLQSQKRSDEVRQSPEQDPPAPPSDLIKHNLMSLSQVEHTHPGLVRLAAETDENTPHQLIRPPQGPSKHPPHLSLSRSEVIQPHGRVMDMSTCDLESVCSSWSVRSGSTFDTRDELAFRDGLAALDASIASLQKTIRLDLKK
nr:uncharacterized protein ccdc14 isoform X2 [Nothobranchius furzeri]